MPYAPGITYQTNAGPAGAFMQGFSPLLAKALGKYEDDKKQREFNTGLLDTLKGDPNTAKYVPVDALERWDKLDGDKQAGVIAGIARRSSMEQQQKQLQIQEELKSAQAGEAGARQNLLEAQAHNEWSGTGAAADATLNLTPDEKAAGAAVGRTPLRTSNKSFQWAEDPNNPANLGVAPPVPVKDPRDPNKFIGLQQTNGVVKFFQKPTDMETLINTGLIKAPGQAAAAPSAAPAATPQLSTQDQQALQWARANSTDPRAAAILKRLGVQ